MSSWMKPTLVVAVCMAFVAVVLGAVAVSRDVVSRDEWNDVVVIEEYVGWEEWDTYRHYTIRDWVDDYQNYWLDGSVRCGDGQPKRSRQSEAVSACLATLLDSLGYDGAASIKKSCGWHTLEYPDGRLVVNGSQGVLVPRTTCTEQPTLLDKLRENR